MQREEGLAGLPQLHIVRLTATGTEDEKTGSWKKRKVRNNENYLLGRLLRSRTKVFILALF